MNSKSLGNPYDGNSRLTHTKDCGCETCNMPASAVGSMTDYQRQEVMEKQIETMATSPTTATNSELSPGFDSSEDMLDRVIENAIVRSVFDQNGKSVV